VNALISEDELMLLAKSYNKAKRRVEESQCYERVLAMNDKNKIAYENLGHMHFDFQRW